MTGDLHLALESSLGVSEDTAALRRDIRVLGELLGAIDVERGAKVSGSRFFYLKGDGALLEFALLNLAINARDAMPHGGKLTVKVDPVWNL